MSRAALFLFAVLCALPTWARADGPRLDNSVSSASPSLTNPKITGTTTGTYTLGGTPSITGLVNLNGITTVSGSNLSNGGNFYIGNEQSSSTITGNENTFVGTRAGNAFSGGASFNTAVGHDACGQGGGAPFAGGSNVCVGTDAGRDLTAGSGITVVGANALKSQTNSLGNDFTAFGSNSLLNLSSGNSNNASAAFGSNACQGASGAAFLKMTCLGSHTGAALTGAVGSTLIGEGVGNTTFASGSGVILIGSGNVTVDTPAAGTSNYLNIENLIVADTAAGHFTLQNTNVPTVASGSTDCGTSPSIAGNDNVGLVTVGSSTNGSKCTVTFHTAWTTAPVCFVQDQTTGNLLHPVPATGTLTINGTLAAGDKLSYKCEGYQL